MGHELKHVPMEAGGGNDPEAHGVDYVAAIELEEEPVLDTCE